MAQLKDLIVSGATRLVGTLFATKLHTNSVELPTSAGGTTYGPGTNGQVLKSNGSTVYWGADNNTTYTAATAAPPAVAASGAQGSSANYARQDHTHQGITGITMNGASKGTSGVVNLGTVVTDVSGKENTSNKVTSISSSSTDTQYPSAKCVYTLVGNIESLLAAL